MKEQLKSARTGHKQVDWMIERASIVDETYTHDRYVLEFRGQLPQWALKKLYKQVEQETEYDLVRGVKHYTWSDGQYVYTVTIQANRRNNTVSLTVKTLEQKQQDEKTKEDSDNGSLLTVEDMKGLPGGHIDRYRYARQKYKGTCRELLRESGLYFTTPRQVLHKLWQYRNDQSTWNHIDRDVLLDKSRTAKEKYHQRYKEWLASDPNTYHRYSLEMTKRYYALISYACRLLAYSI